MKKTVYLIFLVTILIFITSCSYFDATEGIGGIFPIADFSKTPVELLRDAENLACVKFVKKKRHLSKEKRAEYVFEVTEWLKGGNNEDEISLFSKKYSDGTLDKYVSITEIYEVNDNRTYEIGKEYILYFENDSGEYRMSEMFYIPLETIDKMRNYNGEYIYRYFEQQGFPSEPTKEEFVSKLKSIISKTEQTE